ncbi:uncharacterized protein Z519_10155 [Cladophialophora bantiana CBS 173.52]|uniref:Sulphur transport domain-containing protein n=1 Tax=Cladophialophora bantiana (strain ATCC 10958 / CBS 173.52 / CDC B-1940 / NIH 8579) TaxID=1442370 RepID=A0A0D2FRT8_CLAB1|nr:uncharacterized protein Z519_10155 [Cladophialophora bantiana CBS 173.52]KIW89302.1 hypothetical protein Z519_10155 [Cladophialophora bantiana CBS 173.52]
MTTLATSLASGLIFGSALTLSSVASPRTIKDQFRLADFHMLLTFLTASASSAIVIALHNSRQHATNNKKLSVKPGSTFGWFGRYDGNVIGGALLGVGMALTGACPGTMLVQAAAEVGRSRLLIFGGLVAGIAFVKWKEGRISQSTTTPPSGKNSSTLMEATGWSTKATVLTYEVAMLAIIALVTLYTPRGHHYLLHPVTGGLLIGLGQASSVALTKKPVGVSSAYEDFGKLFWWLAEGKATPGLESIVFVAGLVAGARLTMHLVPATLEALAVSSAGDVSLLSALVGGFAVIFGARLAGGCTSGHGISGMSAMGLSSFVTVASMFGSAIATALLVY